MILFSIVFLIAQLLEESVCNAGDPGLIPGLGRSTGEGIDYPLQYSWASLVAQLYRILLWSGSPGFDPWVRKIPCRRERIPTPVFWPGKFHGLYSPSGRKESDSTERLSLSRPMLMSFCAILFIEGRDPILFKFTTCVLLTQFQFQWKSLSRVWLFVTPWTIQSMEFSRPEYWSG